jgi:hypothetical protein
MRGSWFLEHPIDRQSWNMSRGVEYSASQALTFLPARARRGSSRKPSASSSGRCERADCARLRSRPRPSRSLPEVIERERFLQYRFERDNSVLAPAALQSSLDETVPIAPKSAAGEGVTLKITDQGRTDIGAEFTRAFDDFAQLGRPFDNYDLRGLYDLSVTRMAALGLGRSKYQPLIRVNLWIAIRERQQVIFALTCNRGEIHRDLHGWTRDAVDRQKLTIPHVARAWRLRQTFELMAGVRRDLMRT